MDEEMRKLFDERMNRLKEITKLAHTHFGDNGDMFGDVVGKISATVKDSVPVAQEAARLHIIAKKVVAEVDKAEDLRNVIVSDIYEKEAQEDIVIPAFNFKDEYREFVAALNNPEGEDSFIVSQQPEGTALDPWTKQPIKNPMKSKLCGHVFDRASIRAVTQKKRDFRCPYIGCKVRISSDDLEED